MATGFPFAGSWAWGSTTRFPTRPRSAGFGGEWPQRDWGDQLLRELNRQLDNKGLLVKHGTLVDASLIEAQTRPPRKKRKPKRKPTLPALVE